MSVVCSDKLLLCKFRYTQTNAKSVFILSASDFSFFEQICAHCQAELVNAQHSKFSYILSFQKQNHICFSLELRVGKALLWSREESMCGHRMRFSSVLFLSF